ncbi:GTPase HflX [Candidatus Dependentiae bacterium]|nr:GTPase HflX [Candidatus Dependentiae bacterium]
MSAKNPIDLKEYHPKTLLVGVYTPYNKIKNMKAYFNEFLSLVNTLGLKYDQTIFLKLRHVDKANFLTRGKLKELIELCDKEKFEEVIFSESLIPLQERNLEEFLNCDVWDREKLILEIFRESAHTAEGKIQVEMAEIEYLKTRLAGKGVELAQQAGFVGGRGPGETSKEVIRRHLAKKFRQAKKKLEILKKSREVQRKRRLKNQIPLICLIGYTNAGKSSLLNLLTKSHILVEDKLFATLDTTTRELFIQGEKIGLISDTVGFISQLPHDLIEAFKSTLDELKYADLLLHVVDVSNPTWQDQIKIVNETLKEIGVKQKTLLVFNKIDKLSRKEIKNLEEEFDSYKPHVKIHTKSKDGIEDLISFFKKYKFK